MGLRLSLVVFFIMLFASSPLRAYAQESVVEAVIRVPTVEGAVRFNCPKDEACDIQIGDFTIRISLGQRGARLTVSDEFVFFDNTSSTSVPFRRNAVDLLLYDPNSPDFVVNDRNDPVGSIEIRILDQQ